VAFLQILASFPFLLNLKFNFIISERFWVCEEECLCNFDNLKNF
jgi:hypothetical protein